MLQGLSLVGWYHSHPFSPALPSLHDIDAQMNYQLKLQGSGNGFQPCLALICGKHAAPPRRAVAPHAPSPISAPSLLPGPYYHGNPGVESKITPFWVMPPPEVSSPRSRGARRQRCSSGGTRGGGPGAVLGGVTLLSPSSSNVPMTTASPWRWR